MKYEDLRSLSDEDVARLYNNTAPGGVLCLNFWRDELYRRAAERQHREATRLVEEVNRQTRPFVA